jgi:hypothetical protein
MSASSDDGVWAKDSFWKELEEAELLIRPLVDASLTQRGDGNNMAHVLLCYLNLYRFMELADNTSTNLDDPAIDFPELYETYS